MSQKLDSYKIPEQPHDNRTVIDGFGRQDRYSITY